jgi:hypothetical protein
MTSGSGFTIDEPWDYVPGGGVIDLGLGCSALVGVPI